MNIKSHLLILPIILAMLFSGLCSASESKSLTHIVIVWLKPEFKNDQFINQLLEANKKLASIPSMQSIDTGIAIQSERKIVDDSYDIGMVMTFKSENDMNDYLVHPVHTEFLDNFIKGKVDRVVVYDF
jgi:hypothetical protein